MRSRWRFCEFFCIVYNGVLMKTLKCILMVLLLVSPVAHAQGLEGLPSRSDLGLPPSEEEGDEAIVSFPQFLLGSVLLSLLIVIISALRRKSHVYENPANGHRERIDGWSVILAYVFGSWYFAEKGRWGFFFACLFIPFGPLYSALMVQRIMKNHYGIIGWRQVDQSADQQSP